MKYFLILIILGMGYGGYYEYNLLQQKSVADQQQITDEGTKINALQADNKKLEDDKTELTKTVADAQTQITGLTKQLQNAQAALAAAKPSPITNPTSSPSAAISPTKTAPVSNNLGTITMLDGKIYQNCQLLKVKPDGIVVNYAQGITELTYNLLPPELQKRFGYDPHVAATLTDAQVDALEAQRTAAGGGN
jgi:beta-glucosidase-like glycosyl hydrolase